MGGTVTQVVFSGDRMEYTLRLGDGQSLLAMENFYPGIKVWREGDSGGPVLRPLISGGIALDHLCYFVTLSGI